MSLKFLCNKCRTWLQQNSSELPTKCRDSYQWGVQRAKEGDLENALGGVGSAFEMAEMMLQSKVASSDYAAKCLVTTSEVLVRILGDLGRHQDGVMIQKKTDMLLSNVVGEIDFERIQPSLARISRSAKGARNYLKVVH